MQVHADEQLLLLRLELLLRVLCRGGVLETGSGDSDGGFRK